MTEVSQRAREAAKRHFPPSGWREEAIADLAQAFAAFELEILQGVMEFLRKEESQRLSYAERNPNSDPAELARYTGYLIDAVEMTIP